jgi:hypothetical protein
VNAAPLALNHADHPRFVIPSSFVISIFVILEYPFVIYLAAPNFLAFDLRTCPESFRGTSASEVAKIDNGINNSLNEEPEAIRAKQSCQEPLMPRQAGRAANES